MSILDWLGIGKEIATPIEAVSKLYTTDKDRIAAETKFIEIEQKPQIVQLSLIEKMLSSQYFFESAWPALIGWTSGGCIALYYVPQLVVVNILWTRNCFAVGKVLPFPMAADNLMNLVYLLFGFGTYTLAKHTFKK